MSLRAFNEKGLLGGGGFGRVHRGVLPLNSNMEVSVNRVSPGSKQGMKEFISETERIGRLSHRNLVQLLGYCRRRKEILVSYMPNGSLHSDLNGGLGDFGLANLYDHRDDPQTTHVAGTMRYIDPELGRTGMATMVKALKALFLFLLLLDLGASDDIDFTFNGFQGVNLRIDGMVLVTSNGLLNMTGNAMKWSTHAFYPAPLRFKASPAGNVFSFSCTFAFGIIPVYPGLGGHGIVFVVSPTDSLYRGLPGQYLGILSRLNNGNPTNHLLAVELDTVMNPEFQDINDNHVGIDINSLASVNSAAAGYYGADDKFQNLPLISGTPMQVWVEYDGKEMKLDVTLAPLGVAKPRIPLLSHTINLSEIVEEEMYVGFSSSTGSLSSFHYIIGWSFKINGQAPPLNISDLPSLPPLPWRVGKHNKRPLALWSSVGAVLLVLVIITFGVLIMIRKMKSSEKVEDWEEGYGPRRFSFQDLYNATGGFTEKELLGVGGFGRVYRGVLTSSNMDVAVKRVSHGSRQGIKEFIAEIASVGRLRHRNLVQLLGYSRRKKELLLVYSYMPNGSLDKLLFDRAGPGLSWDQRFQIIKGVASGLLYLHEEWEKVIIHRDIKAGNVLLDSDFNGRLGDFGLARLYDHGNDPQTTHVAGTTGYMAPELTRTGRATKATDVFAFGVFLLEVACGRRPIDRQAPEAEVVLLDWVLSNWKDDEITDSADPRLRGEYAAEEMELVLKLGLVCSHPLPAARPTIRQVMQFLLGDFLLPDVSASYMDMSVLDVLQNEGFDRQTPSSPNAFSTDSLFYGGR